MVVVRVCVESDNLLCGIHERMCWMTRTILNGGGGVVVGSCLVVWSGIHRGK